MTSKSLFMFINLTVLDLIKDVLEHIFENYSRIL
jgi:hypothetical protein